MKRQVHFNFEVDDEELINKELLKLLDDRVKTVVRDQIDQRIQEIVEQKIGSYVNDKWNYLAACKSILREQVESVMTSPDTRQMLDQAIRERVAEVAGTYMNGAHIEKVIKKGLDDFVCALAQKQLG